MAKIRPKCPTTIVTRMWAGTFAAFGLACFAGCALPGEGTGWVVGGLDVKNCRSGTALTAAEGFDLRADFFVGDPFFDTNDSLDQRRSTLNVRIQETSNNLEESNNLLLEFHDLVVAANAFVSGQPLPFSDQSYCPTCVDVNPALRMSLSLITSCPQNRAPLSAIGYPFVFRDTAGTSRSEKCLLPAEDPVLSPPCPVLDESARSELNALCRGDFSDPSLRGAIERLLGNDGACLYLCELGSLKRGQSSRDLRQFEVDYGDRIAAIFSSNMEDTRSLRLTRCSGASGHLTGMFSFELVRSRVAQPFP